MREAKQKLELAPAQGLPALLTEPVMGCLLLAVATLAVYWPVQRCDFIILDDPTFVTLNPHIQAHFSFHGLLQALVARTGGIWQPVVTLTYLLDAGLFGKDPTGPHIINLLWHTANGVLLFLVLREMTGAHWRSLLVAALFALHPLHVESVAWVAERKDVVSTCFGLLALWAYARYASAATRPAQAGSTSPNPSGWFVSLDSRRYYLLALLCFALGLLSKPMLVTLPCVMLLLDWWPLKRMELGIKKAEGSIRKDGGRRPQSFFILHPSSFILLEKLPFLLLSGAACLIAVWAQREGGGLQPLAHFPFPLRLENTLVSYARYLGKLFWPVNLALPYSPVPHWPWMTVAYAAALVAGLSALALWLAPRRPWALVGWLWYLGTLVPVIGLVQVGDQSLADRYTYLPYVGLFLVLSWGAGALLVWKPALRTAAAALALALVGACAVLTRGQLRYWQDSETLFTHTLAITEDNWLAGLSLGLHLTEKDRMEEAIVLYQRVLQLQPHSVQTLSHLGAALAKVGRTEEALTCFARALQYGPRHSLTHYRLANYLARLGRTDEAIAEYRLAVRYQPFYPEARNNLAVALFNQGKLDDAIEQFTTALYEMPDDANARCNFGNALAARQRWAEAAHQYAEAARLQPDNPNLYYCLARVLLHLGRRDAAVRQLQEVLRLNPDHAGAKQQLEALQAPATQ